MMMVTLMMNCIVYDDDVSYFFGVVDIDHQLPVMTNCNVKERKKSVNVTDFDFDYYFVEIVCDDDDDFCDDDDVYVISSSFSSFYVSLLMEMKVEAFHPRISFEKKSMVVEEWEWLRE